MPKIIKVGGISPTLTPENIRSLVEEYEALRKEENAIKARKDILAKEIKEYAMKYGSASSTNSHYCEDKDYIYGATAKTTIKYKQKEAVEFLESKGFSEAVIIEKKVDEAKVEELVSNGKLTINDIRPLTDSSTTYSVMVKHKESSDEMPEVDTAKVAASTKPKGLKKTLARRK